jgi:magnesium transporter
MRFIKKQINEKGGFPGELAFIGEKKQNFTRITVLAYNEAEFMEERIDNLSIIDDLIKKYKVVWINIDGIHNKSKIKEIGEYFNIHQLILENILHAGQSPKIQVDEGDVFTIFKMLTLDKEANQVDSEQLSLFLQKSVLLTFQEKNGDTFEPVRNRIRNKKGRIRSKGTDYLSFCLLDSLVDNYSDIIEFFGNRIETLEELILKDPKPETLRLINTYQIELNLLRKVVRPTKDMLIKFNLTKNDLLDDVTFVFMEDLKETVLRVFENIESLKSILTDLLNIYSTHVNHKLNEVMKILTIFSAIFIPLTFIAGIYGTNFDYLPELKFKYSYFWMLGIMLVLVIGMIIFFKRKRWL